MLNQFLWQTYLKAGGSDVVQMFEKNYTQELTSGYADNVLNLKKSYSIDNQLDLEIKADLTELSDLMCEASFLEDGEYDISSAMEYLYQFIVGEDGYSDKDVFSIFSDHIEYWSTCVSMELPELFVPYYFKFHFNVLIKIADEFGIDIPEVPLKRDYEGRFYYYGEICVALYDFRTENDLTPYELYAFLYDFAPKYIGGVESYIHTEIPEPNAAFFIGGTKDDKFLSKETDIVTVWQCSPEAKVGDIAVMYLGTPVSAVDSVWRCVSDGFIDPFFYYYRCAYIAKPRTINQVLQKQLRTDDIFSEIPLVKKNMQGINGVELLPSQYNHLMDLASADVERLEYVVTQSGLELANEKDVENKLIKPLLKQLKYKEEEYIQQLHMEIGNHNSILIPDFVLLPDTTRGQQKAYAIIEAKYNIPNQSEFEEVKIQARSYARQLLVKYSVIASKDKVWVFTVEDDFSDMIWSATWDELNGSDTLSKLQKLIGRLQVK